MGNDFKCRVETTKIVWLVALILASVVIIQYSELPYRDGIFSSLSSDKAYFDSSGAKNSSPALTSGIDHENIPVGNFSPENAADTIERSISISIAPERSSDQKSYYFSNENAVSDISPSVSTFTEENERSAVSPMQDKASDASYRFSIGNIVVDASSDPPISPSALTTGESSRIASSPSKSLRNVLSLAPAVSPSQSVSTRNADLNLADEKNGTSWTSDSEKSKSGRVQKSSPSKSLGHVFSLAPAVSPSHSVSTRNADLNLAGEKNRTSWTSDGEKSKSGHVQKPDEHSVVSISEMNNMLIRSRESSYLKSPMWPSAVDHELSDARFEIEHSPLISSHPGLYAPVYKNLSTFVRSYEIMERKLKIYIYKDGKRPVFHQPRLKGIYASEGWFMKQLETNKRFVTNNPREAHLFYLPFSSQLLVDFVYVRNSHSFREINEYLKNYVGTIKARYPFWNRTDGGDHFLVACHDWAPFETRRLMSNCIRALCNSDVKEGFKFGKDVALPETYIHSPQNPSSEIGRGPPPSERKILAFFAGQMHGNIRPILLKHWGGHKDPDMKIFGRMRKGYAWHMKNSKYCVCAKGYEVNSPRVVEAILSGCVPVIISDNFVPPFFDFLKWEAFAVFVLERDIPDLKRVLVSIPERRYVLMRRCLEMVRQHFVWHNAPVKYDVFHMVLHSVWYNRVLQTARK